MYEKSNLLLRILVNLDYKAGNMKIILFVLISAVVVFMVLLGLSRSRSQSGGTGRASNLTCASEVGTMPDYNGIGVTYTSNVDAHLETSNGRRVQPSDTEEWLGDGGEEMVAKLYYENAVSAGQYFVKVYAANTLIHSYSLNLGRNDAATLVIVCR